MRTPCIAACLLPFLLTSGLQALAASPTTRPDLDRQNRELRFRLAEAEARARALEAQLEIQDRQKWDALHGAAMMSRMSFPYPLRLNLRPPISSPWKETPEGKWDRPVTEWQASSLLRPTGWFQNAVREARTGIVTGLVSRKMPSPFEAGDPKIEFPAELSLTPRPPAVKQ